MKEEGRAITVTIASPPVPTSPKYGSCSATGAVRAALDRYRPDLIECQDAYNLPWAAFAHRKRNPSVAVTAVYMTDFPTAYVHRPMKRLFGSAVAGALPLARLPLLRHPLPPLRCRLGAERKWRSGKASPSRRRQCRHRPTWRRARRIHAGKTRYGASALARRGRGEPLLIYVGRMDRERRAQMSSTLSSDFPPRLAPISRWSATARSGRRSWKPRRQRIIAPGYLSNRGELAQWLASADIYVSAMADETFGVSVIEAQASGLPVVGVADGAMLDRVDGHRRLGPVDDARPWRPTSSRSGNPIAKRWACRSRARRGQSLQLGSLDSATLRAKFIRRRCDRAKRS